MESAKDILVSELIVAFLNARAVEVSQSELTCLKRALFPASELYGGSTAKDFGPPELKAVRHLSVMASPRRIKRSPFGRRLPNQ